MNEPKMEHCVLCKRQTNIPFDRPIDERLYYVEGVGQLCRDCARELAAELSILPQGANIKYYF